MSRASASLQSLANMTRGSCAGGRPSVALVHCRVETKALSIGAGVVICEGVILQGHTVERLAATFLPTECVCCPRPLCDQASTQTRGARARPCSKQNATSLCQDMAA